MAGRGGAQPPSILDFINHYGFQVLDLRFWGLDFGCWVSDVRFWSLDFGFWGTDFGFGVFFNSQRN